MASLLLGGSINGKTARVKGFESFFVNPDRRHSKNWENDIYSFGMILYFLATGGVKDC